MFVGPKTILTYILSLTRENFALETTQLRGVVDCISNEIAPDMILPSSSISSMISFKADGFT